MLAWGWVSRLHKPTMAPIRSKSGLGWSTLPGLRPSCQEDWSVFLAMECTHARPWSRVLGIVGQAVRHVCGKAAYKHGTDS